MVGYVLRLKPYTYRESVKDFALKLALSVFKGLNVWDLILFIYKTQGREAAKRFITPPASFVKAATNSTGADYDQAINERNEAVEENIEFLESLVDKDFEDPDESETL